MAAKRKPKIDPRAVQQRAADLFHVGNDAHSLFPPGRVRGSALKAAMRGMLERTWLTVPHAAPKGCSIKMTFVGDGAFCDSKVIWLATGKMKADAIINLPSVGDGESLSRTQANSWTAYSLHELSHVLFTPSRGWQESIYRMAREANCDAQTAKSWINALEDVDIERNLIAQQYARGFAALVRGLVSHHIDLAYADSAPMLQGLRHGDPSAFPFVLCYALRGYDAVRGDALLALLPAPYRAVYDECQRRMAAIPLRTDATSCDAGMSAVTDVAIYAYLAVRALRANPPQPPVEPQPADDSGDEPADDSGDEPADDSGDEPADDSGDEPADDSGDEPADDSGDEPADDSGDEPADDEPSKQPGRNDALIVQTDDAMPDRYLSTELQPTEERVNAPVDYEDVVLDAMAVPAEVYSYDTAQSAQDARLRAAQHSRTSTRLMLELRRMLTRTDVDSCETGKTAGRLRVAALSRSRVSDAVFERRERMDGINSAVSILIDGSGSMSTADRMSAAKDMALTLGHMLAQCAGTKFEVSVFDSGSHEGYDKDFAQRIRDQTSDNTATCNCALRVCKSFTEPVGKLYERLPSQYPRGGTPDYEAIVLAARRLKAVDAGRRILLVLTDGEGARESAVARYVGQLEHDGVVCIGIGLQFDMGARFPNTITVQNVAELSGAASVALFRALAAKMGGGDA